MLSTQQISVINNPYLVLYVDLTSRCNMRCNFCYSHERQTSDFDLNYFTEVCKLLPKRVLFRFLGGEPTLHPQFFDFLRIAHSYRHTVSFSTNGILLNDLSFGRELKDLKIPIIIGLSMDGGYSHREIYQAVNRSDCLEQKLTALANLKTLNFKRVVLTAILVRNLSEPIVPELLELADKYYPMVQFIHFRSVGLVGRYQQTQPYTVPEMQQLLVKQLGQNAMPYKFVNGGNQQQGERICRNCCYEFWCNPRLCIKLVEFASENATKCWRRGQLLNNNFIIKPFFAYMHEQQAQKSCDLMELSI